MMADLEQIGAQTALGNHARLARGLGIAFQQRRCRRTHAQHERIVVAWGALGDVARGWRECADFHAAQTKCVARRVLASLDVQHFRYL